MEGRTPRRPARPRRRAGRRHGTAVPLVRRRVHREPHARAGPAPTTCIVAYQFEGSPLSDEHGGPVRLYVAPMYGYKSLKWLDRIELTKEVEDGLLGGARLRRRRVGRSFERTRRRCHLTRDTIADAPRRRNARAAAAALRPRRARRALGERHAVRHAHAHRRRALRRSRSRRSSATASSCARCTCTPGSRSRSRCSSPSSAAAGARASAPTSGASTAGHATTPAGSGARQRAGVRLGKFNPGQKLNAAFIAGAAIVMLATGSIMKWFEPVPARLAHRRDVRARLVRARHLDRGRSATSSSRCATATRSTA